MVRKIMIEWIACAVIGAGLTGTSATGTTWMRIYGDQECMGGAVLLADDGGFFVAGTTNFAFEPEQRGNVYLIRTDANGNVVWERTYGGDRYTSAQGMIEADDGSLLLVKLNAHGREVWSKVWADDVIGGQAMIPTADGNYLIAASYVPLPDADTAKEDYLFIMVDAEGTELWRRTFGDPDLIDYGRVMVEAPDGGYVVAGDQTPDLYTWDADISIIKIDAEGQLVWEHHTPAQHTIFSSIFLHPDGGYLIGGTTATDDGFRIFLIKTDADGVFER